MMGRNAAGANMAAHLLDVIGRSTGSGKETVLSPGRNTHGDIVAYRAAHPGLTQGRPKPVANAAHEHGAGGQGTEQELIVPPHVGIETLRPLHEAVIRLASKFGGVLVVLHRKARVSVRRSRQFALIKWEVTSLDQTYDGADRFAVGVLSASPPSNPQNQRPTEIAGRHIIDPRLSTESQR